VRVELGNTGDLDIDGPVQVAGRLLGNRNQARLDEPIPAGGKATVQLFFPPDVPRPGVHALTLVVSFSSRGVEESRAAYLLLGLGAVPDPAVRLFPREAAFELRGSLEVGLESADGAPHTVRLEVATPRGLRAEEAQAPVAVPGAGRVQARVGLLRTGAAHDTRHGVVVVAAAEDGPEARTAAATATVRILPDPALLPRIRMPILGLALALLVTSLYLELRRLFGPR
jgi:hypothetical protein